MVKKKAASKGKMTGKRIPIKTDISTVETETVKRVNSTISAIENFLAKWDASKTKPDDLFPQIVRIRQFHDALLSWQRNALRASQRSDDESRIKRLRDFVLICRTYS